MAENNLGTEANLLPYAIAVACEQKVKLYPLTQEELHAAEENNGYTDHRQWHEIECVEVWVDSDGQPHALYDFWYMGEEGRPEWAQFWVTVRDGKLYGEY